MIQYYKSSYGKVTQIDEYTTNCLINLTNPTQEEIEFVENTCSVEPDFIMAALDDEERARIDFNEDNLLVLLNASVSSEKDENTIYETLPIAIITTKNNIIIVSKDDVKSANYVTSLIKEKVSFKKPGQFTMQMIYAIATQYLRNLRSLDRRIDSIENDLYENMTKDGLMELVKIEKTLVYYNASLSDNTKILKKIMRGRYFPKFEEDEDLMDDTLIELEQAYEMARINAEILRSVREVVTTMANNNLNKVMKTLASITLMLTIPMLVTSFFGMNVNLGPNTSNPHYVIIVIIGTILLTACVIAAMRIKKLI